MSFIAFKISDYEHTAEREQYRVICNLLRSKYEASDELCVFVANYNIFDCEFDGILIKSDAIISIEFKNYGGKLSAFENGHWTLADGAIIKGGSRKSVYQQAKLNHIAIKRGLKEGGILPNRMLKDIPYLIVFAQPIILQNNLSEKVKSWLHICDSDHFIDKIEDVTTTNFNLSNEQILELITKLGLIDEFIDSRFSVDVNILSKKDIVQANSESLTSAPLLDILDTETELIKNEYYQFIDTQVLPAIGLSTDYKLMVVYYKYFEKIMDFPLPFVSEYVTILQVKNASSYIHTLKNLFNKDVISLSSDVISWGEGDFEPKYSPNVRQNSQPMAHTVQKWGELTKQCNIEEIILPSWIDEYIFNELNAQYKPSYTRFSYNLDLNKDECKIYLGTYFPRSFAEGYMSFNAVLHDDSIRSTLESKSVIKILDFGCGTGGEILGFLHAFENRVKANKLIKVIGIDGNQNSLRLLEKIIGRYNSRGQNHVELSVAPCFIESQADLSIISNFIGRDFDFIVTSKAIGEFERKKCIDENGYEFFAGLFAPLLGETGIMSIIDVTTKDEHSGLFLPQRMNIGINAFLSTHRGMFKSIAPCQGFSLAGPCMHPCFYKKDTYISHTAKSKDHSKFTVRFISRAGLGFDEAHIKKIFNNTQCIFK
ncbi:hypothetical protein EEL51_04265 [Muribaculaceae bacterium Isolate-110 (HZI)]|nr:hypothetical protein EEL51_04265 [Muribaculaceae bacterium Isolate-110 (HZI)]